MTQILNLAAIAELAAQAALTGPDMTIAVKGGGGGRKLPDGNAFARLVGYVELGNQPQEYQGVAKEPAPAFILTFALSGYAPNPEDPSKPLSYSNDDGTPYLMHAFPMAMSQNEKAKAFLLFKRMNWKNKATHFAQLIGEAFIIPVYQHQSKKPGSAPRSTMKLDGMMPPLDLVSQTPYNIAPARDEDLRLFLWDHPHIEHWDSLHIAGEYEDEAKVKHSKNRIQETILSATNYEGSALQLLLAQHSRSVVVPKKTAAPAPVSPPTAPPSAPAVVASPVAVPQVVASPAPTTPVSSPVVVPTPAAAPGGTVAPTAPATAPTGVVVSPVVSPVVVLPPVV